MGQKANPISLRLGIIRDWESNWFGDKNYPELLLEDFNLKKYLRGELGKAGISKIQVNRKANSTDANVWVARPGMILGKSAGVDLGLLQEELLKRFGKKIKVSVLEEKNPDLSSRLLG